MGDIFSTSKSGNFPCWKIHHSARRFPHSCHVAPGIPMTSHLLTTFPRAGTWTTKNTWAIPLTSTTCAFFWAGEKWLSWHEFSKTMAYIRRVIMIYIYISHMLHVWYIYLQNWVILFGHFCWVSNWLPCVDSHPYSGWWFGTWFFSPYIGNVIIPTDEHIFQGVGIPPTSININKLPIHTNMHIT